MKTIKIIDLLIMIAKGEKVPKKIKYQGQYLKYMESCCDYSEINENDIEIYGDVTSSMFLFRALFECDNPHLNDEVEIIEEKKEIEKTLDIELLGQCDNWLQKRDVNIKSEFELNPYILEAITRNFKLLYNKQCELIDAVNELKGKENE